MERTAASTSSTDPDPRTQQVAVGRVLGAHGLRGQLRVRCLNDDPAVLLAAERVGLARDRDGERDDLRVLAATPGRPGELRMALAGVEDRDAAQALRGRWVLVPASRLEALPEGEYYGFQLIGCRVEAPGGRTLGVVKDIWPTGGPDLLVVVGEDGQEILIPAARELLREVDLDARRIAIEPPPGLLDPA